MSEIWLAVDKHGRETISPNKPTFDGCEWEDCEEIECEYNVSWQIGLPKGFIKKLLGRELTFEDSPIRIEEE